MLVQLLVYISTAVLIIRIVPMFRGLTITTWFESTMQTATTTRDFIVDFFKYNF